MSDTTARLVEWIEFHLLVGFDHIYVYDNTGAHTDKTSLESTLFPRFMDTEVTRIDWVSCLRYQHIGFTYVCDSFTFGIAALAGMQQQYP